MSQKGAIVKPSSEKFAMANPNSAFFNDAFVVIISSFSFFVLFFVLFMNVIEFHL